MYYTVRGTDRKKYQYWVPIIVIYGILYSRIKNENYKKNVLYLEIH